MDSFVEGFSYLDNEYEFNPDFISPYSDHDNFELPIPVTVSDPTSFSRNLDEEENDFSDSVLKYINQVLMEDFDDLEDKACIIQDSTLHVAEKSFYDVLVDKNPQSPNQPLLHHHGTVNSDTSVLYSCSNCSEEFKGGIGEIKKVGQGCECETPDFENKGAVHYEAKKMGLEGKAGEEKGEYKSRSSDDNTTYSCSNSSNSYINAYNSDLSGLISDPGYYNPSVDHTFLTKPLSFFPEDQSNWQFSGGIGDRNDALTIGQGGTFYLEENRLTPHKEIKTISEVAELDEGDQPESFLKGKKSLHREESDLEEGIRSNKHVAVYPNESVLHEMLANVLVICDGNDADREPQQNEGAKGSNTDLGNSRKGANKREAVNMRSLLTQCMQSLAGNDYIRANDLLKQIRLRSYPSGDGSQRLGHYFANGLEARLMCTGSLQYKLLSAQSLSDADVLKAFTLYLSVIPFMGTSYFFSVQMIMELAEKENTIHIIHFGIAYGLQWAPLIQCLSARPGGPPKFRITGIDIPVAGFRPGDRVKETGHRLANYCKRFNVPFEYKGIAKKWETISIDELGTEKNEVVVVSCLQQLMYLHDDTIMEHSPRDAVLNLIRRISPDIFIHGIVNGSYNSPFCVSRFREALFYFSALFDMFEANAPRENQERMVFEREIWGNQILNIVACEGFERVERPETYKQWQVRMVRAGLRQLPLSQEIVKKVKDNVKSSYHKDFFVDEASQWMLEGWKGRVFFALSCWKPS